MKKHIPRFATRHPKANRSFLSRPQYRLLAAFVCASLLLASIVPLYRTNARNITADQSSATQILAYFTPSGLGMLLVRTVLMLAQGGPPSVPGPSLPDLDASRQEQGSDPVIAPAIPSVIPCFDCQPCPECTNNNPPVAIIGGPYSGHTSDPISFDGSASFDPDGDLITFQWTFGDGGTAIGRSPIHVYTTQGTFTVTLTVTDSHSLTDQASTTASVAAPPAPTPTPPPPGPGNAAVFVSQNVPAEVSAGQPASASVTMRNSGNTTWTAARLYRLGSQNPQDNATWGLGRVNLPHDVLPGTEVTFNFTIIGPPGAPWNPEGGGISYQFQWKMVQDGVEWFGDLTSNQTVVSYSNSLPQYFGPANQYAARLEPANRTGQSGEDLVSGNFNWSTSVLSLAGRGGLNLNLGLALNSLVWTRIGSAIIYDADRGFPGPGFRLGFPSIQPQFSTPQTGVNSYLAIMPSGRRVELRQVSDRIYEAVDSSYLELDDGGNGLLLRAADGSQMSYLLINGEYRCTGIKDRNGNFITIDYNQFGRIVSITDTLNRVITFEYDSNQRLQSIKQNRSAGLHTWATFATRLWWWPPNSVTKQTSRWSCKVCRRITRSLFSVRLG